MISQYYLHLYACQLRIKDQETLTGGISGASLVPILGLGRAGWYGWGWYWLYDFSGTPLTSM